MKAAILADCPGLSPSDLRILDYTKVPRPLFPLDDLADWRPQPASVPRGTKV